MAKDDNTTYMSDYKPSDYVLATTELDVVFAPDEMDIKARLDFSLREGVAPGTPLKLDGEHMDLVAVAIDGRALDEDEYEVTEKHLIVKKPPEEFTLSTIVRVKPEANKALEGLYRSSGVWCTQCEAEGFRRITYSYDRPDVMSVYTVRMEADKAQAPVLLSNGNPVESGELEGNRHFAVWHDPHPKPSYLFAMVAGDLAHIEDSFTTMSGKNVDLAIYVEHGKESQCDWAMDSLKRSMKWDEERFGCEYDLDVFNIVAVSDFNLGAMENKGLNIFNDSCILADPQTATDDDYEKVEAIIAHEYFHNWTGNRITCRDWFQLCLKEGLTVFRDEEFTSDERSRAVKRIVDARDLRAYQYAEDSGPLAHPPRPNQFKEINNFYTATVYVKGAAIVRMIQTYLGKDMFRKGMDIYLERHDGDAAIIEDFVKCFEDASGKDLSHLQKWYTVAGRPEVNVTHSYDGENKRLTINLEQVNKPTPGDEHKDPKFIPIRFGLVSDNGEDLSWDSVTGATVEDDLMILDQAKQTVVFEGVSSKPTLSLFRDFSAPVSVVSDLTMADKLNLARLDKDPFNRWDSLQNVALDILVPAAKLNGEDPTAEDLSALAEAFRSILTDNALDEAFKALALSLPTQNVLAEHIGQDVDPERIYNVRRTALSAIAAKIEPELAQTYKSLVEEGDYSPDARSAGRRALKNQCLSLLLAADEDKGGQVAVAQYHAATNVTDRRAALATLAASNHTNAPELLQHFRDNYCDSVLVFDKWLSLNAIIPDDAALDRVKSLMNDEKFNIENPNRVRSLIGGFAANQVQFGRKDGESFQFVADLIADIDTRTPQLAARLLTLFRSFKNYESIRREAAKSALESLQKSPKLSPDCSDILERTLAG
ncbi:aminopeptidase N [Maritalea porphyrae]|uniref:Aminopeptidase N n=1 Tax=Maritalea porphyrae TaxID=880732 RepID=A0ABQ5UUE9_9HYPH|nr:aminopeptidase N [Maritalea porphyrae]GLQ17975.1 aminopeptidase N [Maritalea porphyrae]